MDTMTLEEYQDYIKFCNEHAKNPDAGNISNVSNVADFSTKSSGTQVTSLSDLRSYNTGAVVKLPDFAPGQSFVARVRRPSLMVLVKSGRIPNSLLATAEMLFNGNGGAKVTADDLAGAYEIMDILCDAALMEPTLKDIKEAGLQLTDEQMIAIFKYTQEGVKALEPFRN